jgi:hypothetical protein
VERDATPTQITVLAFGLFVGAGAIVLEVTQANGGVSQMFQFYAQTLGGMLLSLATVLISVAFAHGRVRARFIVPAGVFLLTPLWTGCAMGLAGGAGSFSGVAIAGPVGYAIVAAAALWSMTRSLLDAGAIIGTSIAAGVTLQAISGSFAGPGLPGQQHFAIAATQVAILVVLVRYAWTVLHQPSITLAMPRDRRECRVCGYDMVNAASRTCPECGTLMPRMVREEDATA